MRLPSSSTGSRIEPSRMSSATAFGVLRFLDAVLDGLAPARIMSMLPGADLASSLDLGPRFTFVTADVTDEAAVTAALAACPTAPTGSSTRPALPAAARSICLTEPIGTG
jgi:hypothetical protein